MKNLVIVESPTKAKTIKRFLDKDFQVESSFGHVRDLPQSKLGVDIENNYKPTYEVPGKAKKRVTELKRQAQKIDAIYLATDADREGEAIAWHLVTLLKPDKGKVKRVAFHEITKEAVLNAIEHPRDIDNNLVDAQQARRVLDRLVGYKLSPFLWKKIARGLSAGRVQSVALRLIVEREKEIEAFKPEEFWSIDGKFIKNSQEFEARLNQIDGKTIEKFEIKNEKDAKQILDNLRTTSYGVALVEKKQIKKRPWPPFITSTLQQAANYRMGFSAKKTMMIAQQLYEGVELEFKASTGLITYMRTDSVNLSNKFLSDAERFIAKQIGKQYTDGIRAYRGKSKNAQEAHEAIRPADVFITPDSIKKHVNKDQFKLYELIWQRAVASQMKDALLDSTKADINDATNKYSFRANGTTIHFDGWLKIYPTGTKENILPELREGDAVDVKSIIPNQHFTQPPSRYSEAGLVKVLEEKGIGRPSTYAPTISTLNERNYVEKFEKRLRPTEIGVLVNDVLVKHFPQVTDYEFTARMEDGLDMISNGKLKWQKAIDEFCQPFEKNLVEKEKELSKKEITEQESDEVCEKCGKSMVVKIGRFGKFLACTGYPDCRNTIKINGNGDKEVNGNNQKELGTDPESGKTIFLKNGKFGSYLQLGEKEKNHKPKTASLLADMNPDTIDINTARQLLSLPKTLGKNHAGDDVIVSNGKYGPYVKAGDQTRSLGGDDSPLTITLDRALELLKQPKSFARKGSKKTLKSFGKDAGGNEIKLLTGRYGPYITDGAVNASVPKDVDFRTLTLEEALTLLEQKRNK